MAESEDILNGMRNGGAPARQAVAEPAVASDERSRRLEERRQRRERLAMRDTGAPVTLTPSVTTGSASERSVSFDTSLGNRVQIGFYGSRYGNDASVSFSVNNSYSQGRLTIGERQAVSMRLLTEMRKDARTRPDGFKYYVTAATGDGFGAERARAYAAIGFSKAAYPGAGQSAIVRNGRLVPNNER